MPITQAGYISATSDIQHEPQLHPAAGPYIWLFADIVVHEIDVRFPPENGRQGSDVRFRAAEVRFFDESRRSGRGN